MVLWEEVRFTRCSSLTPSKRRWCWAAALLLSPHPGRVRAELNAQAHSLHSQGSAAFQAATRRIHDLLFDQAPAREQGRAPRRRLRLAPVIRRAA